MKRVLMSGPLFLAQAFFLWMFFASQGLERLADAGACSGAAGPTELRAAAYRYAAEWRHGLSGGWPLYVPGFFLAAVVTWFWSFGRALRKLVPECLATMAIAYVAALATAPAGTHAVIQAVAADMGIICRGAVLAPTIVQSAVGIYTLAAWTILVLACHRALWWRKYWPLAIPVATDGILIALRPFTFDDLVATWFTRVSRGELLAVVSLILVPAISLFMVWRQLVWERR